VGLIVYNLGGDMMTEISKVEVMRVVPDPYTTAYYVIVDIQRSHVIEGDESWKRGGGHILE
jgi:hypothetical protein